ncbi:hypothetical protein Tco_0747463 [Tanacetum coccineum]|uniref:Uncharacterized protein n=1 Tax=Tanacetum coccineum TaxID=301880 RepID=A0ABQ4YVL0_9ASTR
MAKKKPLIKGNGMKIKLSVSRESSVDKSHEKNLNATSSRKDLESERFQFGATSSSSKVSGSFRRASLKEVKGSPVGTVSSSPLKAPNLDKLSPAAGRTISRKAHAKSNVWPKVPRIDGSGVSNVDTDYQFAERLQAGEQEELLVDERAKLFQQLLKARRKHFAAKRAEEKRNKPLTKAQKRKIMCNYLKNMEGHKLKDLKLKDFDVIQTMFDKAFKRVNTFDDFRLELLEGEGKEEGKAKRVE